MGDTPLAQGKSRHQKCCTDNSLTQRTPLSIPFRSMDIGGSWCSGRSSTSTSCMAPVVVKAPLRLPSRPKLSLYVFTLTPFHADVDRKPLRCSSSTAPTTPTCPQPASLSTVTVTQQLRAFYALSWPTSRQRAVSPSKASPSRPTQPLSVNASCRKSCAGSWKGDLSSTPLEFCGTRYLRTWSGARAGTLLRS